MAVTPFVQNFGTPRVADVTPLMDSLDDILGRRREAEALEREDELAATASGVSPEGQEITTAEQDAALAQLALRSPQAANAIRQTIVARDAATAARMKAQVDKTARQLASVRRAETPQQQDALIAQYAAAAVAEGQDPQDWLELRNLQGDERESRLVAELSETEWGAKSLEAVAVPAGLQEFNELTEGLSEEDRDRARRIELGLDPRAVGSAVSTIASRDDAEAFAEQVGDVSGVIAGSEAASRLAQEQSREAFQAIANVRGSIAGYDDVLRALDEGAETGAIMSRLPSVRANAVALDNARSRLGLAVVGAAQFGALSEGELNLALSTALPTNMEPEALRKWVTERRDAQLKLADELTQAAMFLGTPGNTIADYLTMKEAMGEYVPPSESPATESQGGATDGTVIQDAAGVRLILQNGQWVPFNG